MRNRFVRAIPRNRYDKFISSICKKEGELMLKNNLNGAEKTGQEGQHDFHMFVRPKNEQEELWDGPRAGIENAMDIFNADEVIIIYNNCILADNSLRFPELIQPFFTQE